MLIRRPNSPIKSHVPPTVLVRVRVRVLESSGRNKWFSGRIINWQAYYYGHTLSKSSIQQDDLCVRAHKVQQPDKLRWRHQLGDVGLVVWFSLWVREVPGSTPGRPRLHFCSQYLNFCLPVVSTSPSNHLALLPSRHSTESTNIISDQSHNIEHRLKYDNHFWNSVNWLIWIVVVEVLVVPVVAAGAAACCFDF